MLKNKHQKGVEKMKKEQSKKIEQEIAQRKITLNKDCSVLPHDLKNYTYTTTHTYTSLLHLWSTGFTNTLTRTQQQEEARTTVVASLSYHYHTKKSRT